MICRACSTFSNGLSGTKRTTSGSVPSLKERFRIFLHILSQPQAIGLEDHFHFNRGGMIGTEGARLLAMFIRSMSVLLAVLVAFAICEGQTKKRSAIQWKPADCTSPLMLPDGLYNLSQFGKGQYRIDGKMSVGHFNAIYIIFQPASSLIPEVVTGATESTLRVKDTKVTWRSYKTIVEGRSVIRKEAVMPNILPHEKQGNSSDYIWIRVDADSQQILNQLTPAAEEILRDLAQPQG
jgi:hypothetical protein